MLGPQKLPASLESGPFHFLFQNILRFVLIRDGKTQTQTCKKLLWDLEWTCAHYYTENR